LGFHRLISKVIPKSNSFLDSPRLEQKKNLLNAEVKQLVDLKKKELQEKMKK
jgi:hypothetical protein